MDSSEKGLFARLWQWFFRNSITSIDADKLTELKPTRLSIQEKDSVVITQVEPPTIRTTSELNIYMEEGRRYNLQRSKGSTIYLDKNPEDAEMGVPECMIIEEDSVEQTEKMIEDMENFWNMKNPKLILTLISSAQHFKPWKREQDVEDFQDGLMKAACLSEMWILLDTRNAELTSIVGQAVAKENGRRNILKTEQTLVRFSGLAPLPTLTVIGVVRQKDMNSLLSRQRQSKKNGGVTIVEDEYISEFGDHRQASNCLTHMIVTGLDISDNAINNIILRMETALMKSAEHTRNTGTGDVEKKTVTSSLIGLLKDGGPDDIDHVLALLRKNVPVIVICGQGKAAGLLAFAYKAAQQNYGTDNYETYVKTELLNRLTEYFPKEFQDSLKRNQYRDKILQCVSYAIQSDYTLLTLIERNTTYELKDLSKVIFNAVLTSYNTQWAHTGREELRLNMQLIIDWMQPDLAVTEIFDKYGADKFWIDEDQFEQVLLRPGREEFVDLFLDRGFLMYKYLNPRRLEMLFERCSDKDFFVSICLETVLGEKMTLERPIPDDFVNGRDSQLNHLLAILSGLKYLIDPLQLSLNTSADRAEDVVTAEHRALYALLYWSVLTNNHKLARIFWSRTLEPVGTALVLSTIYTRLSQHWISNHDLQLKIKAIGIEYSKLAIQMLDLCYNESEVQALNCLETKLRIFNDYTVMDLAMIGKNKYFIAHPCCQKVIFNMWYGNVRVSQRQGFFSDYLKICLCLLLVFPTYFWIETVGEAKRPAGSKSKSMKNIVIMERSRRLCSIELFKKLFQLWKAPMVKLWVSQIMFLAFLIYFVVALATPFCGDRTTNVYISIWLLAYICDQAYIVIARKMFCAELPIFANVRAMAVFAYTLGVIVIFRMLFPGLLSFTLVKTLLSFSLIYFCFLAMGLFFPVSPVYGPMLVNISFMMKRDLITWLKMWTMTFISGSVAIQAALYPAYPFSWFAAWRAFKRGIFTIFMTDAGDIRASDKCSCLYNYSTSFGCDTSKIPDDVREKLEGCVNNSFGSYVILLQFIFITKLVYVTLIFTITRVTLSTTYERSVEIWKYQLFLLVINNQWRPMIPPPVVLIYYPVVLLKGCFKALHYFCYAWCPCCKKIKEKPTSVNDMNIWRGLMRLLKKNEQLRMAKLNQARNAEARLNVIAKDQNIQEKMMNSLNDRLFGIINSQTSLSLNLEHMKHVMEKLASKNYQTAGDVLHLHSQHTKCRLSPYPGTTVRRYAVFDKNVSWEEYYPSYDPPSYSKPEEEFDEDRHFYIDPDMFELMKQKEERVRLDVEEAENFERARFSPEFNATVEVTTPLGEKYTVDRTSWITKDGQTVQYFLDSSGVPRNPMGRTGLRGRGNLWRWGPNHMIYAIVSRLKSAPKVADSLEILVVRNHLLNEDSLPGGFISGKNSKYNVLCEVFMRVLLGEKDIPSVTQLDQDDMIQFFRQFVASDLLSGILGRTIPATSSMSSSLVYKGYMDDSSNTDNAWVEAEVWNFHYHSKDKLDTKLQYKEKHWREVSSFLQLAGSQLTHVLDVARMFEDVRT